MVTQWRIKGCTCVQWACNPQIQDNFLAVPLKAYSSKRRVDLRCKSDDLYEANRQTAIICTRFVDIRVL